MVSSSMFFPVCLFCDKGHTESACNCLTNREILTLKWCQMWERCSAGEAGEEPTAPSTPRYFTTTKYMLTFISDSSSQLSILTYLHLTCLKNSCIPCDATASPFACTFTRQSHWETCRSASCITQGSQSQRGPQGPKSWIAAESSPGFGGFHLAARIPLPRTKFMLPQQKQCPT